MAAKNHIRTLAKSGYRGTGTPMGGMASWPHLVDFGWQKWSDSAIARDNYDLFDDRRLGKCGH
jgi:hypothetical protein